MRVGSGEVGASFVAVLLALLIVAALYFGYFEFPRAGGERSKGTNAIAGSRAVACRTNRQTIERQISLWRVDHDGDPPSLEAMESRLGSLAKCPEGGKYALAGGHVSCSLHP